MIYFLFLLLPGFSLIFTFEYLNFFPNTYLLKKKGSERIVAKCAILEKEMLPNPVELAVDNSGLDFNTARLLSDKKAGELIKNPMLMSWYDRSAGRFSPDVTCCSEDKPGWVVYAESRGGNLSVTVNNEQYVFIYADLM